ncbi:MAG: hypothetical protein N2Z20_05205 [Elusimicrobiales bacterium]|nr:hypothetical protein [Elusimicrobiales bacterium]
MNTAPNDLKIKVIIYGITSFFSQMLILREAISILNSGEFLLSFIIGWWIISTAFFSYLTKKFVNNLSKNFIVLFHIFSPLILTLQFSFIKILKAHLTPLGESPSPILTILIVIISISIYTSMSGIYFYKSVEDDEYLKTSKIYLLDTIGFTIAGISLFFLSLYFNSIKILLIISILNFIALIREKTKYLIYSLIIILISFLIVVWSIKLSFLNKKLLESYDSLYGRIELYEYLSEKYLYYNSLKILTLSDKEITLRKAIASNIFKPKTKNIVCISLNLYTCKTLADISNLDITYINQDKYFVEIQKKLISDNKNIKYIYQHPFKYLSTRKKIDFIIIETSLPSIPSAASIFNNTFIEKVKKNLNEDGVYINIIPYPNTPTKYQFKAVSIYISKLMKYFVNVKAYYDDFLIIVSSNKKMVQFQTENKFEKSYSNYLLNRELNFEKIYHESIFEIYKFTVLSDTITKSKVFANLIELLTKPLMFYFIFLILLIIIFNTQKQKSLLIISSFSLLFYEIGSILIYQMKYGYIYTDISLFFTIIMIGLYIGIHFKLELSQKKSCFLLIVTFILTYIYQTKIVLIIINLITSFNVGCVFKKVSKTLGIKSYLYEAFGSLIAIIIFQLWIFQIFNIKLTFLPAVILTLVLFIKR